MGLLRDNMLLHRECLELYLLNPVQMVGWVARRAGTGSLGVAMLLFRLAVFGPLQDKILTFRMQKIFRNLDDPNALIQSAPEQQPYRNETEIRKLFERLAIPLKEIRTFPSCWIARTLKS